MNPEKADEFAAFLKGMLPTMTTPQVEFWAERFESFEEAAVAAAIRRYCEGYTDLNTPKLLEICRTEQARVVGAPLANGGAAESARLQRENEASAEWVRSLGRAELERLKAEILPDLPEWSQKQFRDKDPASNPVWLGLIAVRLRADGGASDLAPAGSRRIAESRTSGGA